jgi:hypothetical protein
VVYAGEIRTLKNELEKKIQWCIENPELLKSQTTLRGSGIDMDLIGEQVINYLTANGYTRISFERLTSLMGVTEEQGRKLIQQRPAKFRYSLISGEKPGIAIEG